MCPEAGEAAGELVLILGQDQRGQCCSGPERREREMRKCNEAKRGRAVSCGLERIKEGRLFGSCNRCV